MSASVDALSKVLLPVLEHAARGQGDAPGVAFSWLCASMAAAAEVSQVFALCVLSKCTHPCNDLLYLTDGTDHRSWLSASIAAAAEISQVNALCVLSKKSDKFCYFSCDTLPMAATASLSEKICVASTIVIQLQSACVCAQICLTLIQKWQSRSKSSGSGTAALCLKLLNLTRCF